jgi:polysaccharide transporter, PST family
VCENSVEAIFVKMRAAGEARRSFETAGGSLSPRTLQDFIPKSIGTAHPRKIEPRVPVGSHRLFENKPVKSNLLSTSNVLTSPSAGAAKTGAIGYLYTYISRFSALGISFFSSIILARILTPSDYGVYSVAFILMSFLLLIRDFGMTGFAIQKEGVSDQEVDFAFFVSSSFGAIISILAFIFATKISVFMMDERAALAIRIMSVGALASSFFVIHAALARRKLMFGLILRGEIAGAVAGLLVGVGLALVLKDFRAIAGAFVASVCTNAIVIFLGLRWMPAFPRHLATNLHVVRFGWKSSMFNVLNFLSNFAGIIGIVYTGGAVPAGHYNRAQQLYAFSQGISFPITTVLLPILSRYQGDPDLYRASYIAVIGRLGTVFMATGGFVIYNGTLIVAILLGPQWDMAGEMFSWFGVAICALGLHSLIGILFVSQGRMSELAAWGLADAAIRVCGTVIGTFMDGPVGAVEGFSIATLFIAAPTVICLAGRHGPVSISDQIKAAVPGAGMAVAVYFAQVITPSMPGIGYDIGLRTGVFVITVLMVALMFPRPRGDIFGLSRLLLRSRAQKS